MKICSLLKFQDAKCDSRDAESLHLKEQGNQDLYVYTTVFKIVFRFHISSEEARKARIQINRPGEDGEAVLEAA